MRAVGAGADGHLDGAALGRERHRVLQEFGRHQGEVADDVRLDQRVRGGVQPHPLVALDLPERGPHDVGQRHGPVVQPRLPDAREQHQAVGVAAQAYGDVVDGVEALQQRRVGLAALHGVDECELARGQVADAAADVAEHLGGVAAAEHLAFQQGGGGGLHPVEGLGEVADLVAGRDRHVPQPGRPVVLGVVVGHPGQLASGHVGDLLRGSGQRLHRPDHRAAHQHREGDPQCEADDRAPQQQARAPLRQGRGGVGADGDLVDQRGGDLQPGGGLLGVGGVVVQRGPDRVAHRLPAARLQLAGVDLQLGVGRGDLHLCRGVVEAGQLPGLAFGREPGETIRLVGVEVVGADGVGELDQCVGVPGAGREHAGLEGAVGGVRAQQGVQQVAGEGRRQGGVAVEPETVDHAARRIRVRGVDVVGREIAPFDALAQAGQGVGIPEGLLLGVRQPPAEGATHLLDLVVHRLLRRAVGAERGLGVAGLAPCGEQDRLLVLGFHTVRQPGHLRAVPHGPGRRCGTVRLLDQVGDRVPQQDGDGDERDADDQVELASEGPAVGEAAYTTVYRGMPGGRVHRVRGHRASFGGALWRKRAPCTAVTDFNCRETTVSLKRQ